MTTIDAWWASAEAGNKYVPGSGWGFKQIVKSQDWGACTQCNVMTVSVSLQYQAAQTTAHELVNS